MKVIEVNYGICPRAMSEIIFVQGVFTIPSNVGKLTVTQAPEREPRASSSDQLSTRLHKADLKSICTNIALEALKLLKIIHERFGIKYALIVASGSGRDFVRRLQCAYGLCSVSYYPNVQMQTALAFNFAVHNHVESSGHIVSKLKYYYFPNIPSIPRNLWHLKCPGSCSWT